MEHPQFSERSTSRFFSSADKRRVMVDHFPVALLGFLPLGFRPLTTPLPSRNDRLCLLHGVVATAFHHVQHWWEPTTIARTSLSIFTLKQGSVKPTAGRTLMFPSHWYDNIVHDQNLPQISFDPEPARRERTSENLFFAGSFQILKILSPGDNMRTRIICRVCTCPQPVDNPVCGHPPPSVAKQPREREPLPFPLTAGGTQSSWCHFDCRVTP